MGWCSCCCLRSSSAVLMSFSQVMWSDAAVCSAPTVTVFVCVSALSCPCCSPRSVIRCGTWCTFTPSATTSTCEWCISTSWAVTWPFGRGTISRPFWRTSSPITPTYPSLDATMSSRVSACQKRTSITSIKRSSVWIFSYSTYLFLCFSCHLSGFTENENKCCMPLSFTTMCLF